MNSDGKCDNLSTHSTLFYNHPNRNFWSARFWRFYAVFRYNIQSAHWKIEKSSFAFSTVVCLIWLSTIKVCGLIVRCAVYVFWLFHLFPYTAKWVCRGIYLKRSGANYPRKYAVLGFLLWQQNYALNVHRNRLDNIISCWKCSLFRAKIIVECVIWMTLTHFCSFLAILQRVSFL